MLESSFWVAMHNGIRWLVVLVAAITLVMLLLGFVSNSKYSGLHTRLFKLLNSLLGVQLLLGIALIVWRATEVSGLPAEAFNAASWWGSRVAHLVFNLLGIVAIGSGSARAKRGLSERNKFQASLVGLLIGSVLIFVGVSFVGGW